MIRLISKSNLEILSGVYPALDAGRGYKKSPNAFNIWALIYVISLFENRDPRLRGDTNKAIFLLGNSVLPWLQ